MTKPQQEFYQDVQPFQKDISDTDVHLRRRDSLYRQLGIVPRLLSGVRIAEFGPGHGENALYTLMQGPREYVLVDGNQACIDAARTLLAPHRPEGTDLQIVHGDIETFSSGLFDVVICEGTIPLQLDPQSLLREVAAHVDHGGMLLITCLDSISLFSEIARRLMSSLIASPSLDMDARADILTPFLEPHLTTLKGMNRSARNWVLDNMIHPWTGEMLSIVDALDGLAGEFQIYGTAPQFLTDWRWYREVTDSDRFNAQGRAQYEANLHNFLDYRYAAPPRDPAGNRRLAELCDAHFRCMQRYEAQPDNGQIAEAAALAAEVAVLCESPDTDTSPAIREYVAFLEGWLTGGELPALDRFAPLFGRGQQYAAFIRN